MSDLWLKIRVWTKVTVGGLLLLYLLVFIIMNGRQDVDLWFWFGRQYKLPALLAFFTVLVLGVVGTLLGRVIWRTSTQIRELRERSHRMALERDIAAMRAQAPTSPPPPSGDVPSSPDQPAR